MLVNAQKIFFAYKLAAIFSKGKWVEKLLLIWMQHQQIPKFSS